MEPPRGVLASLWNFICFLPYFIGLLLLGFIKGIVFCPLICLIMTVGISAIILSLWPMHIFWTNYCILRTKLFGPILKIVLCLCVTVLLIVWPFIGLVGSIIGGAVYGFLVPIFRTFKAVDEGKTDKFFHCLYDGTWDTVKDSFTAIQDFKDVCYHSYFSFMDDLRQPQEGKYYEIRLIYLPGAIVAGILGFMVDMLVISVVALCKSPVMLFKGWHRLFHDCIGREGPFLETFCVPLAGLSILVWPAAVVGAVLGSMVSAIFLGAYAAVVVYQESSFRFGLRYIIASLSIYDEYSNDILDMREGSCFPRPQYRKRAVPAEAGSGSRSSSFSRAVSNKNPLSRTASIASPRLELKPLELLDDLFKECQRHGEIMVSKGLINLKDMEKTNSKNDSGGVISIGLPAYSLLQTLIRSAKTNSAGLLLRDNVTEITSANRPKEAFFDWFFNPLMVIKDQIKAQNLSEDEEDYLGILVLLGGDPERMKSSTIDFAPDSERKRAELDALARRLRGITKTFSRYPTFRRRFDDSIMTISEDLAKKNEGSKSINGQQPVQRSKSAFMRMFSHKSFKRTGSQKSSQESNVVIERDEEIA